MHIVLIGNKLVPMNLFERMIFSIELNNQNHMSIVAFSRKSTLDGDVHEVSIGVEEETSLNAIGKL